MGECIMLHRVKRRIPKFTYTGDYEVLDDGHGNWRIKFLSSGTLTFLSALSKGIDVFLVGGGAGGARYYINPSTAASGGGSGYTETQKNVSVTKGTSYSIVVGAAGANNVAGSDKYARGSDGGDSSAFGYTVNGGKYGEVGYHYINPDNPSWTWGIGGAGGSGGGALSYRAYDGGTDGGNGYGGGSHHTGGNGQGTTTQEFGEPDGKLYASGGGSNTPHEDNSGNGGCVWWTGSGTTTDSVVPSSGIVVIRNHRE